VFSFAHEYTEKLCLTGCFFYPLYPVKSPKRNNHDESFHAMSNHRILILGAGFGGVYTALKLNHLLRGRPNIRITIIDRQDSFLYTPLLPALATGALEIRHISHSLATIFLNTSVQPLSQEINKIDLKDNQVSTTEHTLTFDSLVIALGSETDFHGEEESFPGVFTMKNAPDAVRINNHLIRMFEHAMWEDNPQRRRAYLSFVVVGGGPTGVEMAGEIFDYCRKTLYPMFRTKIRPDEIRIFLVDKHTRILKSLPENLSLNAEERIRRLGIEILFDSSPLSYEDGYLRFANGSGLETFTVVWASGIRPSKLVRDLPIQKDSHGKIIVTETLELPDYPNIWAIGDNASCVDKSTGEPYPATAQIAVHQAHAVAQNIRSCLLGKTPKSFYYHDLGEIVPIGDNYALYAAKKFTAGGLATWFLWNLVHIFKLPVWHCRLYLTTGLVLKTFFGRSGTPLGS
jgi:NADH dehydrogenase